MLRAVCSVLASGPATPLQHPIRRLKPACLQFVARPWWCGGGLPRVQPIEQAPALFQEHAMTPQATQVTRQTRHQLSALALSAVFTLSILSSIDMLANKPAQEGVMAASPAASQVVVVSAKRLVRG
jgi:hypothetical protein